MNSLKIDPQINVANKNSDVTSLNIDKSKGVVVFCDSKNNKGVYSNQWATYLCKNTPFVPLSNIKGFELFLENNWESFYENSISKLSDAFQLKAFETQGSFTTYTACWLRQEDKKIYYQWLSYGNGAVLIYNKKEDDLFVPECGNSLLGFLDNTGLINWKDEELDERYLLTGQEKELDENTAVIMATNAMAEHLVLSYLIIKSKKDEYWEKLKVLMQSEEKLSELIFNNRDVYAFNTFQEVLDKWQYEVSNNTVESYVQQLQKEERLAKDDVTMQVITYDANVPEFTTKQCVIESKPKVIVKPQKLIITPVSKPKKGISYKANKDAFLDVLLDNQVTKLYHFTDYSNLESIRKLGGLYSWDFMVKNKHRINAAAGDPLSRMLDARYGLQNYVRTSFCSNHPMMHIAKKDGRIDNPVLLEIDPVVATFSDTLFSDKNATSKDHQQGGSIEDLKRIRFYSCMQADHFDLCEEERPFYQAEVMVKEFIAAKYILNLNRL